MILFSIYLYSRVARSNYIIKHRINMIQRFQNSRSYIHLVPANIFCPQRMRTRGKWVGCDVGCCVVQCSVLCSRRSKGWKQNTIQHSHFVHPLFSLVLWASGGKETLYKGYRLRIECSHCSTSGRKNNNNSWLTDTHDILLSVEFEIILLTFGLSVKTVRSGDYFLWNQWNYRSESKEHLSGLFLVTCCNWR